MIDQFTGGFAGEALEVPLYDRHREHLRRNGISDELIDERPYYSINDDVREYLQERWDFPRRKVAPEGLVIPRYHLGVEEAPPQIRYDVPRIDEEGEEHRYDSIHGSGGILDFHPLAARIGLINQVEVPLWVPEGIKGADALLSHGHLAVGFQGVWGWSRNHGPAPGWRKIPLAGRIVYIVFDSDVHQREDLLAAMRRFANYLKRDRHACVRIVQVPQPTLDEKLGVDDHYGKNSDSKTYRKIMYRKIPDATDAISEVASAKTKGGA